MTCAYESRRPSAPTVTSPKVSSPSSSCCAMTKSGKGVRRVGLEPTTYGLKVRCSSQLSYRRAFTSPIIVNDSILIIAVEPMGYGALTECATSYPGVSTAILRSQLLGHNIHEPNSSGRQ